MQPPISPPSSRVLPERSPADALLREARRIHRAALSDSLETALPVLRRLLACGAVPRRPLPELFRQRRTVQRKHVLRALALEAGFPSWEDWRPALGTASDAAVTQAIEIHRDPGALKLWFRSESEARGYAAEQGGRVLRVGAHVVVVPGTQTESEAGHD
jgi:hypothetical protein